MRKPFHLVLAAASISGLAALASCASPEHESFYAYPDDYRATGNFRGVPDDEHSHGQLRDDDHRSRRERDDGYGDRYGDRDGDGVQNWRDRYPDDPSRF